jgi:hypothetical protein
MMDTYKTCRKLGTLLALCLTRKAETYHHWKVFTDKSNGVCIHFKRKEFSVAMKNAGVRVQGVKYLKIAELDHNALTVRKLPFLKRVAFKDEGEVRAVYENLQSEPVLKRISIELDIIDRVTLSPWMPKTVASSVIKTIESLSPVSKFDVFHSSLIDARSWRNFARNYNAVDLA